MTNIQTGKMKLTYSSDINCNFKMLTKLLNKFYWSFSCDKWMLGKDEQGDILISIENNDTEFNDLLFPSVFAYNFVAHGAYDKNGNVVEKPCLPKVYDESVSYLKLKRIPKNELVTTLVSVIKKGWIEISCEYYDESNIRSIEKLLIFSDGRADQFGIKFKNIHKIEAVDYDEYQNVG